ncbi:quinolinate synthase NadA [Alkalitalea saponilacus]|uniref:Quinolinate synthase n=1 Tax=Alkalitalea saponilacus TaxID=889453 RepID=A0A1T5EAM9_9BACT|nr:quinolinate synthase NadA [Alkalitalea saponilacus]ASB49053.1 quinolinate synthase [Alkalitalea saponilacus]SKB81014.1 quinolinate synthetase [Alkalitalea saponilacus]
MYNNSEWIKDGYVNERIDKNLNLVEEINRLKKEKNAIIMAHYYQVNQIQDIADFVGDSLALAQQSAKTDADIILLAGVLFMGETAKILSPDKKVLVPDLNAGCSLADSCPAPEFAEFIAKNPGHTVVTYVNTTAAVKALSDIVVTSTNAVHIINSIPEDQPIIFGPDRNLGNYLQSISGRKMVLWDGACHVHEKFSVQKIVDLKKEHQDALLLAHPECKKPLLVMADFIGSTAALLNYSKSSDKSKFIVATESGIIHQMQKASPDKIFIPAPPMDSTCGCNDCEFMKLNTLEKIYLALKNELPEINIEDELRVKAIKPIHKMLEISEKLNL